MKKANVAVLILFVSVFLTQGWSQTGSQKKQEPCSKNKKVASGAGAGAIIGALVGAISGSGKSAAIGAAVGAGAGALNASVSPCKNAAGYTDDPEPDRDRASGRNPLRNRVPKAGTEETVFVSYVNGANDEDVRPTLIQGLEQLGYGWTEKEEGANAILKVVVQSVYRTQTGGGGDSYVFGTGSSDMQVAEEKIRVSLVWTTKDGKGIKGRNATEEVIIKTYSSGNSQYYVFFWGSRKNSYYNLYDPRTEAAIRGLELLFDLR